VTSAVAPFVLLSHLEKALAETQVLGKLEACGCPSVIFCRWMEGWTPKSDGTCQEPGTSTQGLCVCAATLLGPHSPPVVSSCLEAPWLFPEKAKKASASGAWSLLSPRRAACPLQDSPRTGLASPSLSVSKSCWGGPSTSWGCSRKRWTDLPAPLWWGGGQ